MTSPDRYTYQSSPYAGLTLVRKPDGSIEVIIGKDHATGYNSESITLPPSEAHAIAGWLGVAP